MPANNKALRKIEALGRYLKAGVDFLKAARDAGYSETTILRKAEEIKRRALRASEEKEPGLVQVEWSPVSGERFVTQKPAVEQKEVAKSPAEDISERKRREFEAVIDRCARKQQAERHTAFAMSYIPRYRRLDD